jgi:hypothetical protein
MNAPSVPPDIDSPSHDAMQPPPLRRLPLAPIGGWRWSWKGRRTDSTQSNGEAASPPALARPRRMRRCGRAVLLWVLFWYAAVLIVPICLQHRWQRIGPANEERKWPALRYLVNKDADRPLVLMLGSSRACWAFRAGCLNGMPDSDGRPMHVYNFGIPATGPISEYLYLRDMLAEGIRPRFALIEVLPPLMCAAQRGALTEEGMTGFENLSARRFLQWFPYLTRPGKRAHMWLEARLAPWYTFRRQIQLELRCLAAGVPLPTYPAIDDWGWTILGPFPFPPEERERRLEVARGGYLPGLSRFRMGKIPTQALRQTLELCRREHIPAALVVMPESSAFRSWYSDEGKTAIQNLIDELSQTYGVEVIDAQKWLADDDFEDGHHTLLHGADVFTYRLAAELPRLLSQSKAPKSD